MFVRPVLRMDQHAWTEAHVAAFEFFGGVPRRLVPDNLRTVVDKPDLYDPTINRSRAELANHYGTLVDPARARKPKDKPRVERPMPYVRDSLWRHNSIDIDRVRSEDDTHWVDLPSWWTFESKDPTAPLRFVQPNEPPPYQSRDLLLKQCDLQSLDPAVQRAFTLFSSFAQTWERNRGRHIRESEEMLASLSPSHRAAPPTTPAPTDPPPRPPWSESCPSTPASPHTTNPGMSPSTHPDRYTDPAPRVRNFRDYLWGNSTSLISSRVARILVNRVARYRPAGVDAIVFRRWIQSAAPGCIQFGQLVEPRDPRPRV
jgi:hypothetical protein